MSISLYTLSCQCFTGDTLVSTEDGDVRIDEIRPGDKVWTNNVETGEKELQEVKSVKETKTDIIVHVITDDGNEIQTTMFHPFYVKDESKETLGNWVAASNLKKGDELLTEDGKNIKVSEVRVQKLDEEITVYNLEITEVHTYYVAGGVLVHNACADADAGGSRKNTGEGGSNGVYEKAPYHGKNNSGRKNKAPMNGQEALDNSVPIGSNTTRRIGISEGEIVVLDETNPGIFHGHVRSWDELSEAMKAALRKSGKVNKKGKIINDD